MASENPGVFGIDAAFQKLQKHLDQLLNKQYQELLAALCRIERQLQPMATRADLDAVKAALVQAISDATTRVTNDIQDLRNQLANGNPVTDQDLADLQNNVAAVGQIDPAAVPTPAPTP